ncbi:pisatin demethylase [Colletotrichum tofieldiae]|nr:pisatin demethylase [Colletotrichum tofieldiae]GKT78563.1 pisatin demethylase [Colletotrichum tofieldiae]
MWKVTFELYRHFDVSLVGDAEWQINGSWFTPQSNIEVIVRPRDTGADQQGERREGRGPGLS